MGFSQVTVTPLTGDMKKLFTAIRASDLEIVRQIIQNKPSLVNCVAKQPPKKAVEALGILKRMLDMGADVNALDSYGNSGLNRFALQATEFYKTISRDLKDIFPDVHSFSPTNLKYMRYFYEMYPDVNNRQQLVDDFKSAERGFTSSNFLEDATAPFQGLEKGVSLLYDISELAALNHSWSCPGRRVTCNVREQHILKASYRREK